MEFIEYYRIIRRRIWIVVVLAALTTAAVVVARVMPQEVNYPATGRILVHEAAQRQVQLVGNEAIFLVPEEGIFWADLNQFLYSRQVMEAAALEMAITPGEAFEQLKPAQAERIGGSSAATIHVSAVGIPSQKLAPGIGSVRDMAVRYCDAVMVTLDDVWRQRRLAELNRARFALEQRQPTLENEIELYQRRADELARVHDGVPPTGVLDRLSSEMAQIEQDLASGEVARGAAEARSTALSHVGESAARRGPQGQAPIVDPRVQSLRQAILEKQIALDEQLTERTEEHTEVQVLQDTIGRLEVRLRELEAADTTSGQFSPEASAVLLQTQITADIETAAIGRRLELLRQRTGDIRDQLAEVRADARMYEHVEGRLTVARESLHLLLDSLDRLEAEEETLAHAQIFEILTEAEPRHVARGWGPFIIRLAAAVAAGAGLGVLLIFVLHYIDFSFQDEAEAERMLGVPVLAGIPRSDIVPGPVSGSSNASSPETQTEDYSH